MIGTRRWTGTKAFKRGVYASICLQLIILSLVSACAPGRTPASETQQATTEKISPGEPTAEPVTPTEAAHPDPTAATGVEPGETVNQSRAEVLETALAQASLAYLADTPEKADQIAREMGFVDGVSESASNSCGPLSIAIMRDAGLLPETTSLHDIWLLNLRDGDYLVEVLHKKYFPPQEFEYIWVDESVRTYDFGSNPLLPGDWLFLFTAGNGFDHMLVVTRVDESGSPYTVTNVDRGEGFLILEEKLYAGGGGDDGLFQELTDLNKRMKLGLTGSAGFLLVRRKGGLETAPDLNSALPLGEPEAVNWHILVKDLDRDSILFESFPNDPFHPASMIKVPIAIISLQILNELGLEISDFSTLGYAGRSFDQLFRGLIVDSEELAADNLLDFINEHGSASDYLENLGLENTTFLPRLTTAYDLAHLLENLDLGDYLPSEYNSYLIELMGVQTENDSRYFGVITNDDPQIAFYNKRGLLLDPTIVSDMGILKVSDRTLLVVISGTPKYDGSVTYEEIEKAIEEFAISLRMELMAEPIPE